MITFSRVTFKEYILEIDTFVFEVIEQTAAEQEGGVEKPYNLKITGDSLAVLLATPPSAPMSLRDANISVIFEDYEGGDPCEMVGRNFCQEA